MTAMNKIEKSDEFNAPGLLEMVRPEDAFEAKVRWICLALTAAMLVMVFGVTGNYNWMTLYVVGGWTTMVVTAAFFMSAAWQMKKHGKVEVGPFPRIFFFNLLAGINIAAFNPIKGWINQFGMWADPMLANFERTLLLGNDAWVFLTWMPNEAMTIFYGRVWFIVTLLIVPIAAYLRQFRMLILYFLIWGPLALIPQAMFQSGGPIFWDEFGYGDRFLGIPYQENVMLYADYLWTRYDNGDFGLGSGISAMPSVHVMIATWVALAWRATRFKWLGVAFFALTLLLSVALGWHYALDGIVGAALVLVAFKLLSPFAKKPEEPAAAGD